MLDIENSIITLNAMGCQQDMAKQIIKHKANYILALKGNHSGMQGELAAWWHKSEREGLSQSSFTKHTETNTGHGRVETRTCELLLVDKNWLAKAYQWTGLTSIIKSRCVKETIEDLDIQGQLFITRVPQTLKEAKLLVKQAPTLHFTPISPGYEGVSYDSHYGDVAQRAIEKWRDKQPVCDVEAHISEIGVYTGAGRPKREQLPERIEYQIADALFTPLVSRKAALQQLGLFIIATNDVSDHLDMANLLSSYKAQKNVEKGFRFLKSPDFLTSAIYLKKPERIEALLMVMTCCLMVYAVLEYQIRKTLVDKNCYFPDMKYKTAQRPTAQWVFQYFEDITIMYLPDKSPIVANMEPRNQTIVDCLGPKYQKIYS